MVNEQSALLLFALTVGALFFVTIAQALIE
jgi:hypothetical protein